ncbi:transmembrane protein [Acrasis kona]|uniref:Transmembrane protein n=1 Tax=Acrasis kona TaxID=1008807 RepID=A0AAW2ZIT0_9EUKA
MKLRIHIAGLNRVTCNHCENIFTFNEYSMKEEIICPSCRKVVPNENALSHRTIEVQPQDTVSQLKQKMREIYDCDTKTQNLILLNTTFEHFQDIDDYSDNSDSTDSGDEKPKAKELDDNSMTLEQYGIKDGDQIVDVIEK